MLLAAAPPRWPPASRDHKQLRLPVQRPVHHLGRAIQHTLVTLRRGRGSEAINRRYEKKQKFSKKD